MHSERQKEKVQLFQEDTIIVHLMENAVEMNKQNKQQDRIIACISCITMLFVTFFIKYYGYGSIGGGIVAGAFIAFIPIGFQHVNSLILIWGTFFLFFLITIVLIA